MLRMEIFHMARAITPIGGSPPRQKYGGQGGAGLQSSGRAVEHLLPLALILSRNPRHHRGWPILRGFRERWDGFDIPRVE
jgi:hypothetical protein